MSATRAPHLLRVEEGPAAFVALIAAARAAGLRIGWLELAAPVAPPADLETAAAAGALRAVAAGGGRSVAVKPLRGEPVLRDLLREHFRGCALVLVRGDLAAPGLAPDGPAWTVTLPGEASRRRTLDALLADLRKVRPWPETLAVPA